MTSLRLPDTRSRLDLPQAECKVCAGPFFKKNSLHTICSPRCALKLPVINRKAERAERKATKQKLDNLQTLSHWHEVTQKVFNAYIRARDAHHGCISCGRDNGSKVNAGHFLSVGSHPELRYDEANVHKQCEYCNTHKSGNAVMYRAGLVERIGIKAVESLEGPHTPKKYTREQLADMRALYRAKLKELG